MSSLMVSNDLEIMMLEFSVQKLFVPKISVFDSVIMKKTTVMFRMLDYDWTNLCPHRTDYAPYRGSNSEEEDFHGGKSVVFAIPTSSLEKKVQGVEIQIHVRKEISRYFEMDSCQNVGFTVINVDDMFNSIVRELRERKELDEHLSGFHKRQPISRSLKGTYEILDEDQRSTGATITLYVRLSYFGKSVITEIERVGRGAEKRFYAQEETNEVHPYQCKELKRSKLEGGCWGSETFLLPLRPDCLTCQCDIQDSSGICDDEKSDDSDGDVNGTVDDRMHQEDARRSSVRSAKDDEDREDREDGKTRDNGGDKKNRSKGKDKKTRGDGKDKKGKKSAKDKEDVSADIEKIEVEKPGKRVKSIEKDVSEEKKEKRGSKLLESQDSKDPRKSKKSPTSGSPKKGRKASKIAEIDATTEKIVGESDEPKAMKKSAGKKVESGEMTKKDDSKDQKTTDEAEIETTEKTKESANRHVQFRRRHRGIVTVGFQDKEKKICLDSVETATTSIAPENRQIPDAIRATICTNIHSHSPFCCPTSNECKTTLFLPVHCSMDTRNEKSCGFLGRPNFLNITEMPILTS